jgi:uncharacterized protein
MPWRYDVADDGAGHPRWLLCASSGQMVAYSGEAFDSFFNAALSAQHFKESANRLRYEIYADPEGSYRWRARARNGETVAASGASYGDWSQAEQAAESVRANARKAAGP